MDEAYKIIKCWPATHAMLLEQARSRELTLVRYLDKLARGEVRPVSKKRNNDE